MNKSKYLDQAWDVVEELISIHKEIRDEVDFTKYDKTHAIYLILGGMISSLIQSFHALEKGNLEKHAQSLRVISESMDLALFFNESEDHSRQIKQWFKGRIIKREPGNSGNLSVTDRAKIFNTDVKVINRMEESVKVAVEVLSKYMHPSFEMMTHTFDNNSKEFHYYAQREEKFTEARLRTMIKHSLLPVTTAFGMSLYTTFFLNEVKYLKSTALITRKMFPEAFKKKKTA